jgi:hypothetical protein
MVSEAIFSYLVSFMVKAKDLETRYLYKQRLWFKQPRRSERFTTSTPKARYVLHFSRAALTTKEIVLNMMPAITNISSQIWPVCHVRDNAALYIDLLRCILLGQEPDHGKNGYYLASSGSVPWIDIYNAMAKALAKRKVVDDEVVKKADDAALEKMGHALHCPKEFVAVQLGGKYADNYYMDFMRLLG